MNSNEHQFAYFENIVKFRKGGILAKLQQQHKKIIYQIKNIHFSITPGERGQNEKPKLVSNSIDTIVELAKVVQGTFHPGKTELFGETAGSKFFCMALVVITYSVIKGASRWNQTDLDIIILNGDAVYKMLGKQTNKRIA